MIFITFQLKQTQTEQKNNFNFMLIYTHCTFNNFLQIFFIKILSGYEEERNKKNHYYVFYLNFDLVDRRMLRVKEFFALKKKTMKILILNN